MNELPGYKLSCCQSLAVKHWVYIQQILLYAWPSNPCFGMNWDWLYMHLRCSDDLPTWQGRCLEVPFFVLQGPATYTRKLRSFFRLFSLSRMLTISHWNSWGFQCSEKLNTLSMQKWLKSFGQHISNVWWWQYTFQIKYGISIS